MKQNWPEKRIGDICEILDNKRIPITKRNRRIGKYPYYGATGVLDFVCEYIFNEKLVLIGEDGAKWKSGENTAFIADGKYWVNNHAHVIRPNRDIVLDDWLVFYFNLVDLTQYTTGLTVPKLNQSNLRNIMIILPSLDEQQRIVKVLNDVFENITKVKDNLEQNLQNSKDLFESYLQSVFANPGKDWEEKRFDEIIKSNVIGLVKNIKEQSAYEKYKYVKMNNITRDNNFDFSKYTRVNATKAEVEKYNLINGDFLFNTRNSYELVGKTCIFEGNDEKYILFNNNIMRVRFTKICNSHFINYAFSSRIIINKLKHFKSGTTNVSAIYYKDLKTLVLPIPSTTEQNSIVSKLDALSAETKKLEYIFKQKLDNLEELRKSVLKCAFSGEL